jgi:hypothetical protein
MARKPTNAPEKKTRNRRTEEQRIADLQAEIERLQKRAVVKKAKKSPALKALTDAVRSIDTALRSADSGTLKKALSDAREPLAAYLAMEGVPIPQRRGRKPKAREAGEAA